MTDCPMCIERGKDWTGDDPTCAFPDQGPFFRDNWNCATMNKFREICSDLYNVHWKDDENYCVVPLFDKFEGDDMVRGVLILQWYKSRGRVSKAYIISEQGFQPLLYETVVRLIEEGLKCQ